jgi:hypothetical protein
MRHTSTAQYLLNTYNTERLKRLHKHRATFGNMLFQISYNQPIKADSHFFRPILLKLAGNVKNGKNRIPLFLFFFKMKNNEDIRD